MAILILGIAFSSVKYTGSLLKCGVRAMHYNETNTCPPAHFVELTRAACRYFASNYKSTKAYRPRGRLHMRRCQVCSRRRLSVMQRCATPTYYLLPRGDVSRLCFSLSNSCSAIRISCASGLQYSCALLLLAIAIGVNLSYALRKRYVECKRTYTEPYAARSPLLQGTHDVLRASGTLKPSRHANDFGRRRRRRCSMDLCSRQNSAAAFVAVFAVLFPCVLLASFLLPQQFSSFSVHGIQGFQQPGKSESLAAAIDQDGYLDALQFRLTGFGLKYTAAHVSPDLLIFYGWLYTVAICALLSRIKSHNCGCAWRLRKRAHLFGATNALRFLHTSLQQASKQVSDN